MGISGLPNLRTLVFSDLRHEVVVRDRLPHLVTCMLCVHDLDFLVRYLLVYFVS